MSDVGLVVVAVAMAVGLVGILVPVLPGTVLVFAALLVWAIAVESATGWAVFSAASLLLIAGQVAKYVVPGRQLTSNDVPASTIIVGTLVGIVGFFVLPVVGLPLGFVVGIYAAEQLRLRSASRAWSSTVAALKATGMSILIELVAALSAAILWATTVLVT